MNLSEMRRRTRQLLDEASATFWSDDELNWYINEAYKSYYMTLVMSDYAPLRKEPANLSTVAGVNTVSLPSDFLSVALLEVDAGDCYVPLEYFERYDSVSYKQPSAYPRWRIVGTKLYLDPPPDTTSSTYLRLHYYPRPTTMSADSDSPDAGFIEPFHGMIPVKAAIIAKEGRQESDTGGLRSMLATLEIPFLEVTENVITDRQFVQPYCGYYFT